MNHQLEELARALNLGAGPGIAKRITRGELDAGLVRKAAIGDMREEHDVIDIEAANAEAKALLPFVNVKHALLSINGLLDFAMDHRDDRDLMSTVLRSATKALRNTAETIESIPLPPK